MDAGSLSSLMVAFGDVGGMPGRAGVQAGRKVEVATAFVKVRSDCVSAFDVVIDVCEGVESGFWSVGFGDRDDPIEARDRSVGEAEQLVVPLDDLGPVGLVELRGVGVQRRNRRLGLVLAEAVARERVLQDVDAILPSGPVRLSRRA